jgi:hypothetical protein
MTRKRLALGSALLLLVGIVACQKVDQGKAPEPAAEGVAPETVTNYVHAVIEADRTFYTVQVVERLQKQGKIVASEDWRIKHTLPLPAQFLKESSNLASLTGTKVRYRLIGIWPINPMNGAETDFEKTGLAQVQQHPEQPYTGYITEGNVRYFSAVYADRGVTEACVGCHNAHPGSQKRDFKLNDVMGAVVITIPMSS